MTDSYLQQLVINRCRELGDAKAAEFFGVSPGLVRQWVNGSKTPSLSAVEKVFSPPENAPAETSWAGKEVFIAAPFHKSTNPMTLFSLLAVWDRQKYGFRHRFGDAYIIHARNQLAGDFLLSGMPYIFWIDDDMVIPNGSASWFRANTKIPMADEFAGVHAVNRLRSREKSLVGGLYFGRWEHGKAMYAEAMNSPEENARAQQAPVNVVKPTEWVGTGCLLHTREVLLDIQKTHPHLAPQHPTESWHFFSPTSDGIVLGFSDLESKIKVAAEALKSSAAEAGKVIADAVRQAESMRREYVSTSRLQQGEDVTFCRRAARAGHQPHVDLSVVCGHVGSCVFGPHNTGRSG